MTKPQAIEAAEQQIVLAIKQCCATKLRSEAVEHSQIAANLATALTAFRYRPTPAHSPERSLFGSIFGGE